MLGLRVAGFAAVLLQSVAFSEQDTNLTLDVPVWTNGQVQFTLHSHAYGGSYIIEHSSDLLHWTPVLTNTSFGYARLITADAPDDLNFYRAGWPLPSIFSAALAAIQDIDLKGNNITVDSFDSGDTDYCNADGSYPYGNVSKTKAGGDVCTDFAVIDSLNVGNANIKGHLKTGPGINPISLGPNGTVGERAWVEGGNIGIEPGWSSNDFNAVFHDVVLPSASWLPAPGPGTVGGVAYSYAFISSGDYAISNLSGKIYVATNQTVRLNVTGSALFSANDVIRIAPGARLTIYMQGSTFSMGGNSYVDNQTRHAEHFSLYGLPTCNAVYLAGHGELAACIYAPSADYSLRPFGTNITDFVGSSATKSVTMNGHFNLHYDENLRRIGPFH